MKIKWIWHFVKEGVIEPDPHNRWMVVGHLQVKTSFLTEYKWYGEVLPVPVAWIFQKGCAPGAVPSVKHRFGCMFSHIHPGGENEGITQGYIYSDDINELQKMAEEQLEHVANCFKNAI